MKRLTALGAVVLALTAASACIAAGDLGKFKTKLTGNGAATEHGMLDGTWTIDLSSPTAGKVDLTWDGHHAGGGTYVISGSTITLTPKQGGGCTTKAKYTLRVSGKTLAFKRITDTCTQRRDVLTAHPWTRVG
jgi:hypothetical protein